MYNQITDRLLAARNKCVRIRDIGSMYHIQSADVHLINLNIF